MFVVSVSYIIGRLLNLEACYVPDEEGIISVYDEEGIKAKRVSVEVVIMVSLTILVLTFAAFKLMFYLKVYESFGQLVQLLTHCIDDIQTFNVFLLGWIFYFCIFYKMAGVIFYPDDYPGVSPWFISILQTYRNSIGDIAAPSYPLWIDFINSGKVWEGELMIFIIWMFWFVHQYLILIILLNFLIAIISGSYEHVMSQESLWKYMHRCELNLECFVILNQKRKLDNLTMMIMATPLDPHESDLAFTMKTFMDKRQAYYHSEIIKRLDQDRAKIEEETQSIRGEIKAMEKRITNLL